ncbi:DoxX family protein [Chitinophaga polysaccharea]|uniref:DoxX family protein n=1 Tax=Chitinophaga TaxID=79328 RepID=UPI0014553E12|nr:MULTISPECIES: DoxX family protein [Chitinophaga]NLR62634.1 DoxX family protein [Chitinophaga polysaccharea]NLU91442.1 DoxX family protein [Chitinophaga sp. Ak27]
METQTLYMNAKAPSKSANITGWVITILCVLFLLVDAVMKIGKAAASVQGSAQLGWPETQVQGIGIVLLLATILYAIPRTAVLGAVFVSCYLGGAVAVMSRLNAPYYFPIVFGILIWVSLFLRIPALRALFPLNKA